MNGFAPNGTIYLIDGQIEVTVTAVWRLAISRGFDGSLETIRRRLKCGVRTWVELSKPVDASKRANRQSALSKRAKSHDEVQEAIASVNSRKREMGL